MSRTSISSDSRAFPRPSGVTWSRTSTTRSASWNGPKRRSMPSRRSGSRYVCHTWTPLIDRSRSTVRTTTCSNGFPEVLTLAFDTATSVATAALVRDGEVLGERASRAVRVLADADDLLREAGKDRSELGGIVVGVGPGSFTGLRLGLA